MSTEIKTAHRQNTKLIGTAGLVMGAFVLSRALGLLREALLGIAFGTNIDLDAFRAASRVTETLYILVAGGALGSAFIPTFTSYLARDERRVAWQIASAITNLVFLVTLTASIVMAIVAPWLVSTVLAPGFEPTAQALTVDLLRWMLASTVLFSVSGLLMGILNANDHFVLPAIAPSMYNLGIIVGVAIFARSWGIYGAAIGTVVGALLHLAIQLPAFVRLDWTYSPILGLHLSGVREVGRLMGPRVLGMAITQLHFWVNINLGSRIGIEGVVAALNFGWLIMLLPHGIFAQAIATVLFPSLSAQVARKEQSALRATLLSALQVVLYLTLPTTVGLIVLRKPFVEMFFLRGAFDSKAVSMVSWALAWYAVGLVAHSELEIVTRAFYALHDTATPVWVGGGAMALNVGFSLTLSWLFERLGKSTLATYQPWMPLGGLALANSLATTLETATLIWLLYRRLGGLEGRRLWASAWRITLSAAAMGGTILAFATLAPTQNAWASGAGGITIGVSTYLVSTFLLRSPELTFVLSAIRRKLSRA
jgi:putative peptidoglycan lipid II flippase